MAILNRAAALLLLAAALAACERDPLEVTPAEDQLMVHGILEPGRDTVLVYLTETRVRRRGQLPVTGGVPGAAAELVGGGVRLPLHPVGDEVNQCIDWGGVDPGSGSQASSRGCLLGVVPGGLRAGERYELRITLPDGRRVRGEAHIPPAPALLAPAERARLDAYFDIYPYHGQFMAFEPVVLRWRGDPAWYFYSFEQRVEKVYEVDPDATGPDCGYRSGGRPDGWQVDSLSLPLGFNCHWPHLPPDAPPPAPDSALVRLRIGFVDTAFVRYQEEVAGDGAVRRSEVSVGLEGAVGIFTALAVAERRLVLLPRPFPGEETP